MKKTTFAMLAAVSALVLFCSCSKEPRNLEPDQPRETVQTKLSTVPEGDDPIDNFYSDWSEIIQTLIKASNDLELCFLLNANLPEIGALSKLRLTDGQGNEFAFMSLPKEEMLMFIRIAAKAMAEEQHRKAEMVKDVKEHFFFFEGVMSACREILAKMSAEGKSVQQMTEYFASARGDEHIYERWEFIKAMEDELMTPVAIGPVRPVEVPFEKMKAQLSAIGKKGMIVAQLPVHGRPNTLINISHYLLSDEEMSEFHNGLGHVNILAEDFTDAVTLDSDVFYGVDLGGARYEPVSIWCVPFYAMELKKLSFIWDPNCKTPLKLVKEKLTDDEINAFIEEEFKYKGYPFVGEYNLIDLGFSKYRMPAHGFTCAGLVWYCLRNTLDIDISNPWLPTIFPINIICSIHTDIISVVE